MRFEWDPAKAKANVESHGVDFAEAVTVLEDDFAFTREDSDALDEQRFATLDMSSVGNLLVVVYTLSRTRRNPANFSLEGQQTTEVAI